jgi:hypothetical protein
MSIGEKVFGFFHIEGVNRDGVVVSIVCSFKVHESDSYVHI